MKRTAVFAASLLMTGTIIHAQSALSLHETGPADFFEESFVLGNGNLGAIVYGGVMQEKVSLNDITLWTGEPDRGPVVPDAWKNVAEIRRLLDEENYKDADALQYAGQGHYSNNYQPLGHLLITNIARDASDEADEYQRVLDISEAVSRTSYVQKGTRYTREYFVSAPDSAIVIRMKAEGQGTMNLRLELSSQLPSIARAEDACTVSNEGYAAYLSYPNYYYQQRPRFFYDPDRGIHFRTVLRAIPADGSVTASDDGRGLEVRRCTELMIIVSNVTSFNGADKDPVKEGRDYRTDVDRRIAAASMRPYEQMKADHVADYKSYFDRVRLDLGTTDETVSALPTSAQLRMYYDGGQRNPDLEELYFQYGRYLLISSSRTPGVPANLQGLWNEQLLPPWSSNYTSNINVEENYWAAETANLSEMHGPLLSFISRLPISGERTAKAYYGVQDGWCLAHNTDIWAITNPVGEKSGDPFWANWNMGGAWIAPHLWDHYCFTMDKTFLRESLPVLKGAADFCMGWLVEKNGELITSPSTSPEARYITPDGYVGGTLYGGTADLAMVRECLLDTRKAYSELGISDPAYVAALDRTLARLHPYRIGKAGNLQEWYHDWEDQDPQHRHQSHLYGLYPGHQILDNALGKGNPKREALLKASARTLEIKGDNTTGWSTGWRVNLFARLRDADGAYGMYRRLLKYVSPDEYKGEDAQRGGGTYPNLLDAHSPFQIDGNFGGCAGVAEMLVQSGLDEIRLLPALPEEWQDGQVCGLCTRGGFVIDMSWKNGRVTSLTVTARTLSDSGSVSARSTSVLVNGSRKRISLKPGESRTLLVER
ncbi:MAG: glycoside hydrolase family 95 protein [Bacteroidales bacterium]|nr:glycoside hydrolase family 95 protein [Bacteroidales bacterium]